VPGRVVTDMRRPALFVAVVLVAAVTAVATVARRGGGQDTRPRAAVTPAPDRAPASTTGAAAKPARSFVRLAPAAPASPPDEAPSPQQATPSHAAFAEKLAALERRCRTGGGCSERSFLMDQAALGFAHKLGPDHPKGAQLVEAVGWSHDQRQDLARRFRGGELDRQALFVALEQHFAELARRLEQLLTPDEYQAMFGTPRGENPAAYLGLTPGMARALDAQEVASRGEGAR
jgi:hypothetical protein